MPNQKTRRIINIPDKLYDLITLPDANDYITFRDTKWYPQYSGEEYNSVKWPDELFGGNQNDVIRINIYGNNDNLLKTDYLTFDQFETYGSTPDSYGDSAILMLQPGTLLKDHGFRRGRFNISFDFFRLQAGSPFPLLVNSDEKIYSGGFVSGSDGYLYSSGDHAESSTNEGDRLYVKENKFILQQLSSDRTEIIVSPSFINDDSYLENFRMAGFNCLNHFADRNADGSIVTAAFEGPESNFIVLDSSTNLPREYVNGTIRINNAYFGGKRVIEETRELYTVNPEIEIENAKINLIETRNLDSLVGWQPHTVWPTADAVISDGQEPLNKALYAQPIAGDEGKNPVGNTAIKLTVQNILNHNEAYITDNNTSITSVTNVNYSFVMKAITLNVDIEATTMNATMWVKVPVGWRHTLQVHSGPWGVDGDVNTSMAPYTISTGEWTRLTLTFLLTQTDSNKMQLRLKVDPTTGINAIDPAHPNSIGVSWYCAGATIQLGSNPTKFMRENEYEAGIVEVPLNNTIRFADPNGKELHVDFSDAEKGFQQNMLGGIITIKDAIAVDDLSSVSEVNDAETNNIFDPVIMPAEGDAGIPGGYAPNWDVNLHGQAINVTSPNGDSYFSTGYDLMGNGAWKNSKSGTAAAGYHAHWVLDKGVNGNPCMFFPDLNYQEYILEDMKNLAEAAWTNPEVSYYLKEGPDQQIPDPRLATLTQPDFGKRKQYIATWDENGTGRRMLGTLASFGVMPGDTLRVSWMQKSKPVAYNQGERKGAAIGIHHSLKRFLDPPTESVGVTTEMVSNSDALVYHWWNSFPGKGWDANGDSWDPDNYSYDPDLVIDEVYVNRKPEDPPAEWTSIGHPPPDPPSQSPNQAGQVSTDAHGLWTANLNVTPLEYKREGDNFTKNSNQIDSNSDTSAALVWSLDEGKAEQYANWSWNGHRWIADTGGDGRGVMSPGYITDWSGGDVNYIETNAFGWVWSGTAWLALYNLVLSPWKFASGLDENAGEFIDYDTDINTSDFSESNKRRTVGRFRHVNPQGRLVPILVHPSYDELPIVGVTLSDDSVWKWVADSATAGHWEFNNDTNSEVSTTTSGRRYLSQRTLNLSMDGSVPGRAFQEVKCEDYDSWEQASYSFEVSPQWDLTDSIQLFIYGHYGDYGTLYVDQLKLDVVTTSNMRVKVDDTAMLAPLELTIDEVVSSNVVRVTDTYDQASAGQGNILSNYKVNKYCIFDQGFEVDFVQVPERIDDIFLRYEGKILDVLNDGNHKKIIVDKSYNAYGNEINAILNGSDAINPMSVFEDYFVRYRLKDPDNLYTYIIAGPDTKSLIINFKPVNSQEYPGSIAYKLMEPLSEDIEILDMVYIVNEVTPSLEETVELIPFIDEKIPETVLRLPKFQDLDSPIRDRSTEYLSHTDLVGSGSLVREQLEDRLLSGSLEAVSLNVDYRQYENFSHFGSIEQRFKNFKTKLSNIEIYTQNSASLTGNWSGSGYLGNELTSSVSSASIDIAKWELMKRQVINGFDDFENYMYFQSSSYVTSSNGEYYDNTPPKSGGDGTLISPYVICPVTSSEFISWYDGSISSASIYDRKNTNRLVNNLPEHVTYDQENSQFILFMDMMGHHYDHIWTHIRALTDVHDRSEDVTKGISQALVEPVAKSLGFELKEGRDLVRLPQYHLGLQESGSGTGIYNVRYSKRSQKDLTREIWNRILATMPYMLKAKGTKQSLKALIAAYGIPTSILRVQEYGGPKISGKPDFEIKQRFTKAVDFKGGQYIKAPWYYTGNGRAPDTIEFRFKSKEEVDQILVDKRNSVDKSEAMVYITNVSGIDTKGDVKFVLSGSTNISMSIANQPVYNGEYWSLMVRRRTDSISGSYEAQSVTSDTNPTTQSFDMFLGYYDAGIDEVIVKASSSMDVSGSLIANWYQTSSLAGDNKWYIGGKADVANKGAQFSGSLMEFRYWNSPLSESAFWNHVGAPKAINGNHESSSYFDMSLRFSMDDNVNLNTSPYGIKDYSVTDGQLYATASSFNDEVNFSNVSDRSKAFMPNIGFGKSSNKIRIEDSVLKTPDGVPALLSPTERVEVSSYDLAGNDSNKLGIFFAPTDVINEDIILSVADLDYGKYLGDPRDMYEDRYTYGRFDRVADTYWKKWTSKSGFWDYIKLIKYYDLSLFDHLRKLSPGRAKKNLGLLFEPTLLERTKVVMGAPPMMEDLRKSGSLDLNDVWYTTSGSRDYKTGTLSDLTADPTSSNMLMRSSSISPIPNNILTGSFDRKRGILDAGQAITSSNLLFRSSSMEVTHTGSWISSRVDYETKVIDAVINPETMRNFGLDYRLDFDKRDYVTASVYTGGGESGGSIFFEVIPPMVTGSRMARHNEQYTYYYDSKQNAADDLPSSSSLGPSEYESVYDSHTGLFNLAYAGCKEDGSTVPFGNPLAVEIIETNPYNVTSKTTGNSYVDVDLNSE